MAKYLDLEAKVGIMSAAQLGEQQETETKKEEETDGYTDHESGT